MEVDIAIIGGGPVGNTLAVNLEALAIPVALMEEKSPETQQHQQDNRAIALTYGSSQIFRDCKLWEQLVPFSTPLKSVHVSKRGGFGFTQFNVDELGVPALGYVVEMTALMSTLVNANLQAKHCQRISPAKVTAIEKQQPGWQIQYEQQGQTKYLQSKILIAADGANSTVRQLMNIQPQIKDYHEHAIVTSIKLANQHNNIAYERFTDEGPIAMLPRSEQRVTGVWTLPTDKAKSLLQQDKSVLLKALQTTFGYRLGRFLEIDNPISFPLRQLVMPEQVFPGLVFLGNAAHNLHPIAAQGFNLGLSDIKVLVNCLLEAQQQNISINDFSILENYMKKRQFDQKFIMHFTDSLTQIFTNNIPGTSLLSNVGMIMLDKITPIKKMLARTAMGLAGF